MATATKPKPRVKKKLADVGEGSLAGLVDLKCAACGKKFSMFEGDVPERPLCLTCDWDESPEGKAAAARQQATDGSASLKTENRTLKTSSVRLPLNRIAFNRRNPRQSFPKPEMEELQASMNEHGLIEPIVVRLTAADAFLTALDGQSTAEWEIVAGERRARAAKNLGWTEIDAIVRECQDDAAALELSIEENLRRKDVSQVELAAAFHDWKMETGGNDQAAATKFGYSLSGMRNLLRLLDAPEAWRKRVVSREISGTHLRHALPYLHAPTIEKELAKRVAAAVKKEGGVAMSEKDWQEEIADVVVRAGERLHRYASITTPHYVSTELRIDPKHPQYAELDVVTVAGKWGGKQTVALNAPLAKAILDEKEKAWAAKAKSKGKAKSGKAKPLTPAQAKKKAEEARVKRREDLQAVVFDWRRWLCSRYVAQEHDAAEELIMLAAFVQTNWRRSVLDPSGREGPSDVWEKRTGKGRDASSIAWWFAHTIDEQIEATMEFAAALLWSEKDQKPSSRYEVEDGNAELLLLCNYFEIDLAEAWRAKGKDGRQAFAGPLTDRFFALLNHDQLVDLCEEWKVPVGAQDNRNAIEKNLRSYDSRVFPLPRELAEIAAAGKKRKAKAK